ncbi:hypothetical protein AXF42_Ash011929 [Apostasia shenzhenica]|uniref:Uncharacterized protein n=1 Tax=Apostasia shenzhenica TaxID=1088818 RepID=A0A2I0AW82_9ASPA|nr:hypothetical protein AXF42_Ash011929 [Apostasia shenzhenica]
MGVGQCKPLPPSMTVSSFSGNVYRPAGFAPLRLSLQDGPRHFLNSIDFLLIDAPSSYNVILGRPPMAQFRMVPLTFHLCIKFPTPLSIATIRGEKADARKCFEANICLHTEHLDLRDHLVPPDDQNQHVIVSDGKSVLVSKGFPENNMPALTALLSEYFDVFAWGPEDMPGIDRSIVEHKLSLSADISLVRQKKKFWRRETSRHTRRSQKAPRS